MATEMSTEETPKTQQNKIDCKCRRSVLTLLRTVENYATNVLLSNNHSLATGAVIAQTYKSALLSNILIENKTLKADVSDLDTTTEFEPFDTSKEHYIEHVLMDRLDRRIVSTTRMRKTASKQVRRKMKHLIRPQLKYSALVSVQTPSVSQEDMGTQSGCETMETQSVCEEAMETDTPVSLGMMDLSEVETRLQGTSEKCSYMQQNCKDMLQKCRDLSQALQIFKQSEKNEVVKAIYETPPSTPTLSSDRPTLNKALQGTKSISKKLLI